MGSPRIVLVPATALGLTPDSVAADGAITADGSGSGSSQNQVRYQAVVGRHFFAELLSTSPKSDRICEISFRPRHEGTYTVKVVSLALTQVNPANHIAFQGSNWPLPYSGQDRSCLGNGAERSKTVSSSERGTFCLDIPLDMVNDRNGTYQSAVPFQYDPLDGNLLLDFIIAGPTDARLEGMFVEGATCLRCTKTWNGSSYSYSYETVPMPAIRLKVIDSTDGYLSINSRAAGAALQEGVVANGTTAQGNRVANRIQAENLSPVGASYRATFTEAAVSGHQALMGAASGYLVEQQAASILERSMGVDAAHAIMAEAGQASSMADLLKVIAKTESMLAASSQTLENTLDSNSQAILNAAAKNFLKRFSA